MKSKLVKRLLIIIIIAAAAAGSIFGGLQYRKNSRTAQVTMVSDLNSYYWGDEFYSSGIITNDQSQSVYVSSKDTIKEVLVEEGQEVQIGDKLVELDVTATELDYNMKVLEVENIKNQIEIAQNDLKKWKNTTPVSTQTAPAEVKEPDRGPEKTGNAYNYITVSAVPYNLDSADGSAENPYRYLCRADAYVLGEKLLEMQETGECAVFEIYENDIVSEEGLLQSWTVNGSDTVVPDGDSCWSVASRTQVIIENEDDGIDEMETVTGYTKEEINEQIAEYEEKLKELDLSKRKAELEVKKAEAANTDGFIYATVSGVVKNLQDAENPPTDGTAFMEISGSEGLYVTGALSELLLEDIEPGQTVTVYSWESGVSTEAQITEIFDYPTTDGYAYGEGNQNVSYYPYTAYIEDTSGLHNGEYVDLTMTLGSDTDTDTIYLSKAYLRTENGKSYVYKADENDRLVKQYVETGKTIYGESVEIKSGLTLEDRIAFPYGNTAKEGIRVVDSEGEI